MSTNPKRVLRILGQTPSEAVHYLENLHLCAAAWGTPHFKQRDKAQQTDFRGMAKVGDLYAEVEKVAMLCIQLGAYLSDDILDNILEFAIIPSGKALPAKVRDRLARSAQKLRCIRIRLAAEEIVFTSDDFPEPVVTGRWAPKPIRYSKPMTIGNCAKLFEIPKRDLLKRLTNMGVRFQVLGRQTIQIAVADLPDEK